MLSATLQQYPVNFGIANMMPHGHMPQQQLTTAGLDTLAEGSQYHLQQLQQQQQQQQHQQQQQQHQQQQQQQQQALAGMNGVTPVLKHRQSYGSASGDGMGSARRESEASMGKMARSSHGQAVRRRISRACDQCNQLRTKCDGKHPCAHCGEFGLTCEYIRERKKRGKASRKDVAAQQAAVAGSDGKESSPKSTNEHDSDDTLGDPKEEPEHGVKRRRSSSDLPPPQLPPPRSNSMSSNTMNNGARPNIMQTFEHSGNIRSNPLIDHHTVELQPQRSHTMDQQLSTTAGLPTPRLPGVSHMPDRMNMGDYRSMDDYHRSMLHANANAPGQNILHSGATGMPASMLQHGGPMTAYPESQYAAPSPGSQHSVGAGPFRIGESPMSAGFLGHSPAAGSPGGWLSLPSPSAALYPHLQQVSTNGMLRYPVLRPLLPHISAILPIGLACDLLELYFSSSSSAFMQPQSPYILGYVFRKRSFLRAHNIRLCSPALLASMLWVAAQTSESAFLTSPPSARGKICQKLLELTVGLLKPLIHAPTDGTPSYGGNTVINGVALGGFGVALPGQAQDLEGGSPGATGALDDVVTYINLATVVSASEYKAASLRWWNAAWSLARELKLGRELPHNPEPNPTEPQNEMESNGDNSNGHGQAPGQQGAPGMATEEEREERRRIWWLLYIVDRHLALCYNRPLFLLDIECDGLLQPENEAVWQGGEYYPPENYAETSYFRRRGPTFECTGHSIFGYFLPLMTILGEIVDLNHARNHPRFGLRFRQGNEWDDQAAEISQQLEAYGRSLKDFEAHMLAPQPTATEQRPPGEAGAIPTNNLNGEAGLHGESPSAHSVGSKSSAQRMTEAILQTKIVVAYGTHLMHTLHILLNGKWDPISLLDDNDLWISSQSFISATGHAVSAAEAINDILDYDPDLSFMPFFFGIYLLQGSFLLLLIADKLQGEASPSVVKACETIVRAHEACVVTLNTEYQRNFRKVMRSALAQVRGRSLEDFGEQQLRRREMLALYRWTGDGTGLAL
ncbi:hypothetical protein LTR62_005928 [Meristemomyces frigidus]|uniref:Zn(2)-C6 fungal-type domain-containing protein n=1 Tax=Meristemomyces frigidus TaxID=1508187 RepID=A0AAN7TNZ8_9PEZI|nr:hypothetical protein LTR62_005928 [Meristemomyces frigidus]